jgi:hypothetical protein
LSFSLFERGTETLEFSEAGARQPGKLACALLGHQTKKRFNLREGKTGDDNRLKGPAEMGCGLFEVIEMTVLGQSERRLDSGVESIALGNLG